MTAAAGADGTPDDPADDVAEALRGTGGTMYYVGYNENFGNYKADTYSFNTQPEYGEVQTSALSHSANENDDERDDVDFEAYILRITDEDGDVVSEGDDVSTLSSSYLATTNRLVFGTLTEIPTIDCGVPKRQTRRQCSGCGV